MVRHYRRLPALLVLVVATAAGAVYVKVSGKASGPGGNLTLEQLEKVIADHKDHADTWEAYGELLLKPKLIQSDPPRYEKPSYEKAAGAFRQVFEKEWQPEISAERRREAQVHCALALAQSSNADEFYNYIRSLIAGGEPKLAMELLERQECKPHLSQARFVALAKEAQAQAMD